MVKRFIGILTVLCSFIFTKQAFAQQDSTFEALLKQVNLDEIFGTELPAKKSYFKVGLSYINNYVYAGRTGDTSNYPYLTPTIEYNHKTGLYASISNSFLAQNTFTIDLTSLALGYSFDIGKKASSNVYIGKYFYANNSNNTLSNVGFNAGSITTYTTKYCNINAALNFLFGTKTDFTFQLSIDKTFYLADSNKNNWSITPAISVLSSTTGFNQNYRAKDLNLAAPPNSKITISSPSNFQLMSYELSAALSYDNEKWGAYIIPSYAIPVNAISTTYTITTSTRPPLQQTTTSAESLSNKFYTEVGIYYKF